MVNDAKNFIPSCDQCQRVNPKLNMTVPSFQFLFLQGHGNKYVLDIRETIQLNETNECRTCFKSFNGYFLGWY